MSVAGPMSLGICPTCEDRADALQDATPLLTVGRSFSGLVISGPAMARAFAVAPRWAIKRVLRLAGTALVTGL